MARKVMRWLFILLFPVAAWADERPMTAAEFEAFTTGKTLTYSTTGTEPYGAEEYLPGRRVRWAFTGQECRDGEWFEADGLICFVYEDAPSDAQCWSFFLTPRGLSARFENRPDATPIYQIEETNEPLFCPGPLIGV